MRCPNCNRLVPANEWIAYRRHENCAMGWRPRCATVPAAVRNAPHDDRRRKVRHVGFAS